MNLQQLQKVQDDKFYFEISLRQAKKELHRKFNKLPRDDIKRTKSIEIEKIRFFTKILTSNLNIIPNSFPKDTDLNPFYKELIENNIGIARMKRDLSMITGAIGLIFKFQELTIKAIRIAKTKEKAITLQKIFLGRTGSVLRSIRKTLADVEIIRQKLKNELPTIKTGIKTVCIVGYPNVGKSTLLKTITTANPEINVYPFTTKSLMVGYVGKELQLIDSPGTFRDKNEMNTIEKQSYLAIKHLADIIVFVIDYTESCGYEIPLQEEMLNKIKKEFGDKKLVLYASKSDMMNEEQIKKHSAENVFFDPKKLRIFLLKK